MEEFGLSEVTLVVLIPGALLLPAIFFLLTLQRALGRCSPESRTMEPGEVWLLLYPPGKSLGIAFLHTQSVRHHPHPLYFLLP
jgi:hypothetical protein